MLTHTARLLARCCLALCLGWAPTAWAADLLVTTLSDTEDATDGVCTLREAITAANSDADFHECVGSGAFGADTITPSA